MTEVLDNEGYRCDTCYRIFTTKGNLHTHLTKKNKCVSPEQPKYQCENCGKAFTRSQGLEYHLNKKNPCIPEYTVNKLADVVKLQQQDLQQIQETLKIQLQLLPLKSNEITDSTINENSNNTTNNTTNNTNNTNTSNSHNNLTNSNNTQNNTMSNMNNTCLINYVVQQYPNAKNIEDCIKIENIPKMTLTDCEDLYFTDGAMKIFKGLCDLGEENRPIHCTDASRCNYIYKSNDVWKIDVGGEAIRNHFFPVIQEAYTQVHKRRIKDNPGNSTIIGNYLTEMTGANVKKICQKTLKKLSNDFLAKNSRNSKLIKMQENNHNR
jgi:Zinc finger, C2H2 type